MMKLRAVTSEQDIDEVAELAYAIWNQHFPPIIGDDQVAYMVEKFQSIPAITEQISEGFSYYLIEHQDEAVGYLALVPDPLNKQIQLSKFYIIETMRGRGIGRAAYQEVMDIARARGYKNLWLTVNKHNTEAIDAYQSMGFSTTDSLVMDIGSGYVMDDFKMEIEIAE